MLFQLVSAGQYIEEFAANNHMLIQCGDWYFVRVCLNGKHHFLLVFVFRNGFVELKSAGEIGSAVGTHAFIIQFCFYQS